MRGRRNAAKATIEHKDIINSPIELIIFCTRLNILLAGGYGYGSLCKGKYSIMIRKRMLITNIKQGVESRLMVKVKRFCSSISNKMHG